MTQIKLIHPNKRTVYPACSLRKEGDLLIAGFVSLHQNSFPCAPSLTNCLRAAFLRKL